MMSKSTASLIGAMALALGGEAAWRWWSAPGPDMDAPADPGLYHHKAPDLPSRKGDSESFHYAKSRGPVGVADQRLRLEDLGPAMHHKLGLDMKKAAQERQIPLPPAVEAALQMLPAPRSVPKVAGAPQLIPQIQPPGGAPLEPAPTLQAEPPQPETEDGKR